MTRTELIDALANETGGDKKVAKDFLEGFTRIVEAEMKRSGEVPLAGLGKFRVSKRAARTGRNPATGEAIQIPAKTVVKFAIAKQLKELINACKLTRGLHRRLTGRAGRVIRTVGPRKNQHSVSNQIFFGE